MTTPKNRSLSSRKSTTRSRLTVRGSGRGKSKPPMAKANKIPPGSYHSTIASIKAVKTSAGDEAVEVIYDLVAADGKQLQMREVIPIESWAFEKFCDALIEAGLSEDDDLTAAVGVVEDVELVYPQPNGFGHFERRKPVTNADEVAEQKATVRSESPMKTVVEEDDGDDDVDELDEFDDFLEDDDD